MDADLTILRTLRARLSKGQCIRQISAETGIRYRRLLQLAREARLRYPNMHPTAADRSRVIRAVEQHNCTIREAAKRTQISKSVVHRIVQKRRSEIENQGGPQVAEPVKAWRCPRHGLVTVRPCLICQAEDYKAGH